MKSFFSWRGGKEGKRHEEEVRRQQEAANECSSSSSISREKAAAAVEHGSIARRDGSNSRRPPTPVPAGPPAAATTAAATTLGALFFAWCCARQRRPRLQLGVRRALLRPGPVRGHVQLQLHVRTALLGRVWVGDNASGGEEDNKVGLQVPRCVNAGGNEDSSLVLELAGEAACLHGHVACVDLLKT